MSVVLKNVTVGVRKNLNIKMSEEELRSVRQRAQKYSDGSVSAWIRYSATRLDPKKDDLKKV